MEIRFANDTERNEWNARILANPDGGNVFQGNEFAEQKKLSGWKPRFVTADAIALTIHEKSVFGLGKLWYLPKGPGITTVDGLRKLLPELSAFAKNHGVFALKIDPELEKTDDTFSALKGLGLLPVKNVQPEATVKVDLTPDIETIMASLNQKGRHAIRRAERDGVTVRQVETNDENSRIFFDLLSQTAAGSFGIRPYAYYQGFWQRYAAAGMGQMFFAYVDGQIVSAAYALVFGEKSTYKDGASVRERTVYGASHLLQWHVIHWAKERGSLDHDLLGVPPSDRKDDETHPFHKLGPFKTSFNKHITDFVGAYDMPLRPLQYKWWQRFGERLTKRLWYQKHHENWY